MNAIVSNPPYIQKEEKEILPEEVKEYEPEIALFSSKEGYNLYQQIIEQSSVYLKKGEGFLALETGYNQAQIVKSMIENRDDFISIEVLKDLCGIERVISAIRR